MHTRVPNRTCPVLLSSQTLVLCRSEPSNDMQEQQLQQQAAAQTADQQQQQQQQQETSPDAASHQSSPQSGKPQQTGAGELGSVEGLTEEQVADKTHEHAMAAMMMGGGPPQWGGHFDNRSGPRLAQACFLTPPTCSVLQNYLFLEMAHCMTTCHPCKVAGCKVACKVARCHGGTSPPHVTNAKLQGWNLGLCATSLLCRNCQVRHVVRS